MFTHLGAFEGIGAFSEACRRTGKIQTIAYIDIDQHAQTVFKDNFPDIPIYSDIRDYHPCKGIDLYTGGFPCTGTSNAGNKQGLNHPESALWFEFLRIINEGQPKFVVIENPASVLNNGLRAILGGLRMQYLADSEWLDIVGTIHKSYRLLSLEAPKKEKDCLSLPTLTTGQGSGRNAGQTRLEKALKDKGFRADTQALSAEGMSVLFGFPPNWAKSICSNPKELRTETMLDGYLGEQSISTAHQSSSNESSILTEFSVNNIDARLQFLLEQRDRLIASGASPEGVWINCGKVSKKDFKQAVWKSNKPQAQWSGNKSQYIGKFNSDEHLSAIAQHKAGQELRKIEREIKKLQV